MTYSHMRTSTFKLIMQKGSRVVQMTTSKHNIERISKLQKRDARIILKADYDTQSSVMFTELGWTTIPNRHDYKKAVLTYKAMNNLTSECITD